MTFRFKQIINQLKALIAFNVDQTMTDDDFIAGIDAANLLCNLHDDLEIDRTPIRKKMDVFYPEILRRIYGKENIQLAIPLIKVLHRYIYGRGVDEEDRGPIDRRNTLEDICCKVVDSYRENPLIHSTDYLYALDKTCRLKDETDNPDLDEYKRTIDAYLEDIDNAPTKERLKRYQAYHRSHFLFISDNHERWAEIRAQIINLDIHGLDDESFLIWREITDPAPLKEMKKRSVNSRCMQVDYLQGLIYAEFQKQESISRKKALKKDLKTLNDEIIGDIIDLKADADMTASALDALKTIFYLRLQLAEASDDEHISVYRRLCHSRYGDIAKAFAAKYPVTTDIDEKIEILEQLQDIELFLHCNYSRFAMDEASKIERKSDLTYTQHLRLTNLLNP